MQVILEVMDAALLILASKLGYQTRAFQEAAAELGVPVTFGTDRCHMLADPWGDRALPLHFEDPETSAGQIVELARSTPLAGIVALGDRPAPTAARAAARLDLPFHSITAADICRDKYASRMVLRDAGLAVPQFFRVPLDEPLAIPPQHAQNQRAPGAPVGRWPLAQNESPTPRPRHAAEQLMADGRRPMASGQGPKTNSQRLPFPWVLKPLSLSGSRGVIRANSEAEAAAAFERIRSLLRSPEVRVLREDTCDFIQIEQYVGGVEVAIEALVERGDLRILAIFDKPDPLVGPFFEETIYVTPSRLPRTVQRQIEVTLRAAVNTLDLSHGPIHAEMRIEFPSESTAAKVWIMEVAARCIGGLCAQSLRFLADDPQSSHPPLLSVDVVSLESLLIQLALGQSVKHYRRETSASGVMMIPIPDEGIYEEASGLEDAMGVEHVTSVEITAKAGQRIVPLPEGASYLGFIFARAPEPDMVEKALRAAYRRLQFKVSPTLRVLAVK